MMNILILHKVPFYKARYDLSINHNIHNVYYLISNNFDDIPDDLRANKIINNENILECISQYIKNNNIAFDRVIALSEYQILDGALIRQKFNIFGPKPQQIAKSRIKSIMKQAILESNIKTSKSIILADLFKNKQFSTNKKLVLKPIDGAASSEVEIFDDLSSLMDYSQSINNKSNYMVEEYISGDIFHFDGLVVNKKVYLLIANKYINNCFLYMKGNPLGSYQFEYTNSQFKWVQDCIDALDIVNGAFHLEAIENNNELYFLEIANRAGGGEIINNIKLKAGINLHIEETKLYLDNSYRPKFKLSDNYFGWFLFPGHHFTNNYCRISDYEKYTKDESLYSFNILKDNQKTVKNVSYRINESPFAGVVCNKDPNKNKDLIKEMFKQVKVTLQ